MIASNLDTGGDGRRSTSGGEDAASPRVAGRLRRRLAAAVAAPIIATLLVMAVGYAGAPRLAQEPLLDAIAAGRAPTVLDVRTSKEYLAGHVPGARHIPFEQVWLRRGELPAATAEPVVVYCSHGGRAAIATVQLWALGYRNVRLLEGQMLGWEHRGLPVETGPDR